MKRLIGVSLLTSLLAVLLLAANATSKRIQNRFIAPCCWQENLAVHQSETAAAMRAEIAKLVDQGMPEEQIVSLYVSRYGERILWTPRGPRYIWLVVIPTTATVIAAACLVLFLYRRWRTPAPAMAPAAANLPPISDDELDY